MNPIALTKLEVYGILGLVLVALMFGAYIKGERCGEERVQVKFDEFKNEVKAAGLKAEQDKLVKEKANEDRIKASNTERDSALERLRIAQARPRSGFVPPAAGTAVGDSKVCYERTALDGALRSLDTGVSKLLIEGDTQVINAATLLKAWPK